MRRRSSLLAALALAFACFVAFVWLNQGSKRSIGEARASEIDDPWHRPLNGAHYGLIYLYLRSGDEELYQATANALRGLPYDRKALVDRGSAPASFDRSPPVDGRWHAPYEEVPIEYPIGMLPFVLLPSFLASSFAMYARIFSALMAALLLAGCAIAMRAQQHRDAQAQWMTVAWLLLAEGSIAVQRLDAIPAFLLALAVWGAAERKTTVVGAAIGLATAVKFLPVLLLAPIVAADPGAWRTRKARELAGTAFLLAAGLGLAPMFFPSERLLSVLRYHAERGLQVESTWAVLLSTWQVIRGTAVPAEVSYGSFNLLGPAAAALAKVAMPATLVALAGLTALVLRARGGERVGQRDEDVARRDRIALAMLAALAAIWLTAKVFSPQYLTWGLPLVLAVSGKRGRTLVKLLAAVMVATQFNVCAMYFQIVRLTPIGEVVLWVRLVLLVGFAWVVVRGLRDARSSDAPIALRGANEAT